MSDMGEDFQALREHAKARKRERENVNTVLLEEMGLPFREQAKGVFRMDSRDGAIMYYPANDSWQHRGRLHRGGVGHLKLWLKDRGLL